MVGVKYNHNNDLTEKDKFGTKDKGSLDGIFLAQNLF